MFPPAPLQCRRRSARPCLPDRRSVSRAVADLQIVGLRICIFMTCAAMTSGLMMPVCRKASERILHHSPDVTSIHYRRSNREDRLRAAWQLWADHVEAMVSGRPAGLPARTVWSQPSPRLLSQPKLVAAVASGNGSRGAVLNWLHQTAGPLTTSTGTSLRTALDGARTAHRGRALACNARQHGIGEFLK